MLKSVHFEVFGKVQGMIMASDNGRIVIVPC